MTPATRTGCSTSRCATSRDRTLAGSIAREGPAPDRAALRCSPRSLTRWTPPTREVSCTVTSSRATCSVLAGRRRSRACLPYGLRHQQARGGGGRAHRDRSCPRYGRVRRTRSWSRGARSTVAPTCTRSAACSSSAWPASLRSSGKPPSPCSGPTSTSVPPRSASAVASFRPLSTTSWLAALPRRLTIGSRVVPR